MKKQSKKEQSDHQTYKKIAKAAKGWDIKIMSYVMVVVIGIAMITATVAWFTHQTAATAQNLGATTASCEAIRVAIESSGKDVVELANAGEAVSVDMQMPYFYNVETYETTSADGSSETVNKMAPGVYGQLDLYVTALQENINRYRITPKTLLTYVDGRCDVLNDDGEMQEATDDTDYSAIENVTYNVTELRKLAKGHMLFYASRTASTVEGETVYSYADPVTDQSPLTGNLDFDRSTNEGTEQKVTVYWCWPYEYDDIPEVTKSLIGDSGVNGISEDEFFDMVRKNEVNGSYTNEQLYDYADTKIGTYIKSMRLHLKVDGYHETT